MLRFLLGFKWQKSPAHLILLSKFLKPHTIEDYKKTVMPWRQLLGEHPKKAIKRFFKEGMLNRAGLSNSLARKYTVPDLKKMLKERNLPISGNKSKLILRLIESDPNGMKAYVSGLKVLICSEQGRKIADDYLALEKEKRQNFNQQVLNAIQYRNLKEASLLVSSFMAKQLFPGTIGIDWQNPKTISAITKDNILALKRIFRSNPKILKDINKECLEYLRLKAAMEYLGAGLSSSVLPPNLETGLVMNIATAARMIRFHARNQVRLAQFRELGCKSVEISTANDGVTCEACQKIENRKYRIDKVPELPYEKCTSDKGCRCTFLPVIE